MAITLLARSLVHKALRKKMAVELSGKKMEPTISRIDWHRFDASWGPVEADLTKLLLSTLWYLLQRKSQKY